MLVVPPAFARMPRWWGDEQGAEWLRELPAVVEAQCRARGLALDGRPWHGSNALVVPVRRGTELLALRLAPPGGDIEDAVLALRLWDGRGAVRLVDADVDQRAMLLERLDGDRTLRSEPLPDAVEILARLTTTLAVPVSREVRSTADVALDELQRMEARWQALDGPTSRVVLGGVMEAAEVLAATPVDDVAVDGDLHFDQVLAAERAPWLVVDPVLLRGDREYDLGRILWSRLDEVDEDDSVLELFQRFVDRAGVPIDRARRWVQVRAMSYLLWGLEHGLTIDPPKCLRLLKLF